MGEISPPPQPVTGIAVGHGKGSEAVLAGYHIGPEWPSACGTRPVFMQDMVGIGGGPVDGEAPAARPPHSPPPFRGGVGGGGFTGRPPFWVPPPPTPPPHAGRRKSRTS